MIAWLADAFGGDEKGQEVGHRTDPRRNSKAALQPAGPAARPNKAVQPPAAAKAARKGARDHLVSGRAAASSALLCAMQSVTGALQTASSELGDKLAEIREQLDLDVCFQEGQPIGPEGGALLQACEAVAATLAAFASSIDGNVLGSLKEVVQSFEAECLRRHGELVALEAQEALCARASQESSSRKQEATRQVEQAMHAEERCDSQQLPEVQAAVKEAALLQSVATEELARAVDKAAAARLARDRSVDAFYRALHEVDERSKLLVTAAVVSSVKAWRATARALQETADGLQGFTAQRDEVRALASHDSGLPIATDEVILDEDRVELLFDGVQNSHTQERDAGPIQVLFGTEVQRLGFEVAWDQERPLVGTVAEGSDAECAGVLQGDRILALNDTDTAGRSRRDLMPLLKERPLRMSLERGGHATMLALHSDSSGRPSG